MTKRELHEMNDSVLDAKIAQLVSQLVGVRESVNSGKEKNHQQMKMLRREIAQAKTILQQKLRDGSNAKESE